MSCSHLSSQERYVISHLVLYGLSLREIGRCLQRHHATISRERDLGEFSKRLEQALVCVSIDFSYPQRMKHGGHA
jgi:IS30 family transposase